MRISVIYCNHQQFSSAMRKNVYYYYLGIIRCPQKDLHQIYKYSYLFLPSFFFLFSFFCFV